MLQFLRFDFRGPQFPSIFRTLRPIITSPPPSLPVYTNRASAAGRGSNPQLNGYEPRALPLKLPVVFTIYRVRNET